MNKKLDQIISEIKSNNGKNTPVADKKIKKITKIEDTKENKIELKTII